MIFLKDIPYTTGEKIGRAVSGVISLSGVVALGLFAFSIVPDMDNVKDLMMNDLNSAAGVAVVEESNVVSTPADEAYDVYDAAQETFAARQPEISVMEAVYAKVISEYKSVLENERDLIRFYVIPTLTHEEYPQLLIERKFQPDENQNSYDDLEYASQLYTTVSVYSWSQSLSKVQCEIDGRDFIRPTVYIGTTQEHQGDLIAGYHDERKLFIACNDEDKPQKRILGSIESGSFYYTNALTEDDSALTPVTPCMSISSLEQAFYDAVQS